MKNLSDSLRQLRPTLLFALMALPIAGVAWAAPFVYVTNSGPSTVSIVDSASNTVVATLPVGPFPLDVVASPDGTRVLVSSTDGSLAVIDTLSQTVVATIPIGGRPGPLAFDPAGNTLYVADLDSGVLSSLDPTTFAVIDTVDIAQFSTDIVSSPSGDRLYVTTDDFGSGMFVIETAGLTVVEQVILPTSGVFAVALSPDGSIAFVAGVGETYAVNTNTFAVTPVLSNGDLQLYRGAATNLDGSQVYHTLTGSTSVVVVDAGTLMELTSITVGTNPRGLALTPTGDRLYVANNTDDTLSVIDMTTNLVIETVDVGERPDQLAIPPEVVIGPTVPEVPTLDDAGLLSLAALLASLGALAIFGRKR